MSSNDDRLAPSRKRKHKKAECSRARGPYLQHLSDPNVTAPRTSSWRDLRDENRMEPALPLAVAMPMSLDNTTDDGNVTATASIEDAGSNDNLRVDPEAEVEQDLFDMCDVSNSDDIPHGHDGQLYSESESESETETETEFAYHEQDQENLGLGLGVGDQKPLYQGSRLTLTVSMLLIATFVMKHGLSGECTQDLLTLIELHCLSENICCTSLYLYQKYFSQIKMPIEKHFYCGKCFLNFNDVTEDGLCPACRQTISKATSPYFIVNPLSSVLQSAFSRKDFLEKLRYRTNRTKKNPSNIEDVLDGQLYHQHFDKDGFFHGTSQEQHGKEVHISFQLNTDGVSVFKSTKTSMWPVYLVINEMHPKQRFSRTERIFLGVWFGQSKPFFRTFMKPFAEIFKDVYSKGIKVNADGRELLVRGILLSAVFDSPARCLFQEFVQFNGAMGCPFCKAPGETVRTAGGGHTRAYPFNVERMNGHYDPRTHVETKRDAVEAHRTKRTVNGVKGHSWFLHVPKFDIINSVAADYMHGLVLGVMKMLISLWFDSSYHREPYSLSKKVREVDSRLNGISPPHNISRMPRNIGTHLKFWKASEFRSFLLFYSIPCLWGIMPQEYFQHFLLLNEASFILLSDSISDQCLKKAEKLLCHFCLRIEALYGKRYQTWNVHSLLHYVQKVRDLGPLWANSCFWYEDFNGDLMNFFNGTRGIEMQIISATCLQQAIPQFLNSVDIGTLVYDFLMKLTEKTQPGKNTEKIGDGVYVVGSMKLANLELFPWHVRGRSVKRIYMFLRLKVKGVLVSCRKYRPGIKRNSYTVRFSTTDGTVAIGHIEYFIKCYSTCPNDTFCNENCICQIAHYFAVIKRIGLHNVVLSCDQSTGATVPNIIPVEKGNEQQQIAINISCIKDVCMWIDIKKDFAFIGIFPNFCEKD